MTELILHRRKLRSFGSFLSALTSKLVALWIVITLTFFLMKALPGDPFTQEQALPKEIHEALKHHFGLDQSAIVQYGHYLDALLHGDLGPSYRYPGRSVNSIIREGFPISAVLGLQALILALTLGILSGILSAAFYHKKWQDTLILLAVSLAFAAPSFLLAVFLQYFFGYKLNLFPIARWGSFSHSILPSLALALCPAAFIARLLRSQVIEVLKKDYIHMAYVKGLNKGTVLFTHTLRNALLPLISYIGPLTANILTGSFAVEKVFAIPGLGQWFVNSILARDFTVIMGLTVFYTFILLLCLYLAEIAYGLLDPRINHTNNLGY
jgi:oligopeptide transport system permease protein